MLLTRLNLRVMLRKIAFSLEDIHSFREAIGQIDVDNVSQTIIDNLSEKLCKLYLDPAKAVGMHKEIALQGNKFRSHRRPPIPPSQPWFNSDCVNKRGEYIRFKKKLKKNITEEKKRELRKKAKEYKRFLRKQKRKYRKEFRKVLKKLRSSNPKEYWSLLNKGANNMNKIGNITLQAFMQHFKQLGQVPEDETHSTFEEFDPRNITHAVNEEINKEFTLDEVKKDY